jgi:hypothetical protein
VFSTTLFAVLLCCYLSCSEVAALCEIPFESYDVISSSAVLAEGESKITWGQQSSCYSSAMMGLWATIEDADQDELTLTVFDRGVSLGSMTFNGDQNQQQWIPLLPRNPSDITDLQVIAECTDGSGVFAPACVGRIKWSLGDCSECPENSDVRKEGTCGPFSLPSDTECNCFQGTYWDGTTCEECAPGTYQADLDQIDCSPCPVGSFGSESGEIREACSGLCPAGTYGDIQGLDECKKCPNFVVARRSSRIGLTQENQCGSFSTAGFWQLLGSGSVAGDNSVTFTFSKGVAREDSITDSSELSREVGNSMEKGTNFETSKTQGWSITAGGTNGVFSASGTYSEEYGTSSGEFSSYAVSKSVVNSLSRAVMTSTSEFSETGCSQECSSLPGTPSTTTTVYGWRWVHIVYDEMFEENVVTMNTCETYCLYDPDGVPLCPPGRCANKECTSCIVGTFADAATDDIASKLVAQSGGGSGGESGGESGGRFTGQLGHASGLLVVAAAIAVLVW